MKFPLAWSANRYARLSVGVGRLVVVNFRNLTETPRTIGGMMLAAVAGVQFASTIDVVWTRKLPGVHESRRHTRRSQNSRAKARDDQLLEWVEVRVEANEDMTKLVRF